MKTKTYIIAILLAVGLSNSHAQDTWIQKADFGGGLRDAAASFTIGNKGYVGTGQAANLSNRKDFWEYDPTTNTWTRKADFGGAGRFGAVGFSIGAKGYIGTGINGSCCPFNNLKDVWEYDPTTDAWTQKADFGGGIRNWAASFAIGNKGYVGTGGNNVVVLKDFWEFDPIANTWSQKADFGGIERNVATGLSIGGKGYIGTGTDGTVVLKDFWEYDLIADTWTRKADFGGTARLSAVGFSIDSKGYLGTGDDSINKLQDFWEYTPGTAQTNPVPLINQPLVPDAIAPGGAGFSLTVNGTGFVPGSVVNWNGSARATTFVSNSQLSASILASDIAIASTASITVVNPSPGGGESNVVFLPITNPTSSVSLNRSDYATGSSPDSVATADFNRDGKLDLAVANFSANTVSIFLGNGDGTFETRVDYATGGTPSSVAVGDFNGDGKLDLVLTNGTFSLGNSVSVLLGNGDGTFQAHVEYRTGLGPTKVVVGDFNLDGKLDLAVANYGPAFTTGSVSILLGNGDGTFQARMDYAAGVNPIGVMVGDFDNDGAMDLAVGDNNFPQGVSVLPGNGDGTFQSATHYQTQHGPRSGIVADMNLDGKLDLVFAPYDGTGAVGVYIFIGNGDGTFQPEVSYRAGAGANSVNGADFNGDGLLDLAVANFESNNVSVLLGQGDGTFQSHVDYPAGSGPAQLAIGDFNGDGRLDLAIVNQTSAV